MTAVDTTEPGNATENANMVISKSFTYPLKSGQLSYYDWLKEHEPNYKKISFKCTQPGQPGEQYAHLVSKLEPLCGGVSADDTLPLFASFLQVLDENRGDSLIVLRTFGRDGEQVINTIKHRFDDVIRATMHAATALVSIRPISSSQEEKEVRVLHLNELLAETPTSTLICIQEDFDYWHRDGRSARSGKPLVPDVNLDQYFFDDNDCVHVFPPLYESEEKSVTSVFYVRTLDACLDPAYFSNLLK